MPKNSPAVVTDDVEKYLSDTTEAPLRDSFTTTELVEGYLKLKQSIQARKDQLDKELEPEQQLLAKITDALSLVLDEAGGSAVKTPAGSAGYRTYHSYKVVDRLALDAYIRETGNLALLESRVSGSAVDQLELAPGDMPPGVETSSYSKVVVTPPRNR